MRNIFKRDKGAAIAELPDLADVLDGYEVPTFPKVAMAVLRELRDPETGFDVVAEHIALDPGLHLTVMRTINAAAFGLSRKVDDLYHALALLGRSKLESIVVAAAVNRALPKAGASHFDSDGFWFVCAQRACLAREACSLVAPKESAEALTAGLLQDLAVPVLAHVKGNEYVEVYARSQSDVTITLVELEREQFGFDHAQVGAAIARKWELSDRLVASILEHHDSECDGGFGRAVRLVATLRHAETDVDALVARASELLDVPVERAQVAVNRALDDAREFYGVLR